MDPKTKKKVGKTLTSKPVKRVIACILKDKADVVCVQETHQGWEELLMRNSIINKMYKYTWFNHPHEKFGGSGAGFLSKFPILHKRVLSCKTKVDGSMAPALMCTIDSGSFRVRIVNVHLRPSISSDVPSDEEQKSSLNRAMFAVKSIGAYLSSASSVRVSEVKEYISMIKTCKHTLPLLLLGDFNENENGSALTWLLKNVGLNRAPISDITWRWKLWLGSKTDRFDHILYSSSCKCISSRLVEDTGYEGSDHYAVFGSFQF
ncbi:endonuclease/exonuclease/phosphatase family protein [bacterium]|nr:endonuclease/exonuclease/phosphatase family protein [bacterium]